MKSTTEANKGRNEASLKLNELEYSLRTEKASLDRKKAIGCGYGY